MFLNELVALEQIGYQANTDFGDELTSAIKTVREEKKSVTEVERIFAAIISKYTGIDEKVIDCTIIDEMGDNAAVISSHIDSSNPLVSGYGDGYLTIIKNNFENFLDKKGFAEGTIDFKTGKVTGFFSKLPITFLIGTKFLKKGYNITPSETAAIMLHEVGHVITAYSALAYYMMANFVITTNMGERFIALPREQKVKFCSKYFSDETDEDKLKKKILLETNKSENVTLALLGLNKREAEYSTGFNVYDRRSCEAMADMFATRMGYGAELASALNKLHKKHESLILAVVIIDLIRTVSLFATGKAAVIIYGLVVSLFGAAMREGYVSDYDDYKVRIRSIRNQVVGSLKDGVLSEQKTKEALKTLDDIEKIMDNRPAEVVTISGAIVVLFGLYRGRRLEKRLQQRLESLIFSESFATAKKLELA